MELLTLPYLEIAIRMTVAMILGLFVGAQRSHVGKSAGMRTYALVSLGAALFILIAEDVSLKYADVFSFDPLRVASQLVVGIGFLGAGVIFVQRQILTGLTTAAGLWVVAGIGAACGYGLYFIAAYATFLTLFVFEALWYIEEHFLRTAKFDSEAKVIEEIEQQNRNHEN